MIWSSLALSVIVAPARLSLALLRLMGMDTAPLNDEGSVMLRGIVRT